MAILGMAGEEGGRALRKVNGGEEVARGVPNTFLKVVDDRESVLMEGLYVVKGPILGRGLEMLVC